MLGLPIFRLRWLVAAAIAAGGWTYVGEHGIPRFPLSAKEERRVEREKPRAAAAKRDRLPQKVAVPARRPDPRTRTADIVTAAIPRAPVPAPREGIGRDEAPVPGLRPLAPVSATVPSGATPLRPPQEGDCQCPYDLMIDRSACGDRSAYVRHNRPKSICYR